MGTRTAGDIGQTVSAGLQIGRILTPRTQMKAGESVFQQSTRCIYGFVTHT